MAEAPKPAKIATFGVRFESYDDFLVEYTDNLRRGQLMLPGIRNLESGQPVRVKLSLPNRAILYLSGETLDPGAEGGKGTLVKLAGFTAEQEKILGMCVSSVLEGPSPAAEPALTRPLNVLLVDDSASIRTELAAALRGRGLNVSTAENGLMAMSAALKSEPDLILTDVEMPEMDGWTLLRMARARKKLSHIPIVFLTALSDDMSRLQGYRMGVDDYLPKNLPPDEIVARIQGVAARRSGTAPGAESRGLRGDLQHVRLGSVLSFLEAEKKTGDLRLDNGQEHSTLRLVQGVLRDVKNLGRRATPVERVFELLSWQAGQFEFFALGPSEVGELGLEPTSVTYLLMEHARREDEAHEASRRDRRSASSIHFSDHDDD